MITSARVGSVFVAYQIIIIPTLIVYQLLVDISHNKKVLVLNSLKSLLLRFSTS